MVQTNEAYAVPAAVGRQPNNAVPRDRGAVRCQDQSINNIGPEPPALQSRPATREQAGVVNVWTPEGHVPVPFRVVYSVDGPVRLELIEAVEGTIWSTPSDGDVHHLGYWSDDLEATASELEACGYARIASGEYADMGMIWTYHQYKSGPYIEHVSRRIEPVILAMTAIDES